MTKVMTQYLVGLIEHGHNPLHIGSVKIGRTVYPAGLFESPERDAPAGSRAALEGRKIPAQQRMALLSTTLPPSYIRSTNVVYNDGHRDWFIAGWNNEQDVLWLNPLENPSGVGRFGTRRMRIEVHWTESFDWLLNEYVKAQVKATGSRESRYGIAWND